MFKSLIISSFILFCATIIESAILSNIAFLLVVPDLLLICQINFALKNGKIVGESTGFISGLLVDFSTGCPLGFNCLIRTVIGYITGFFADSLIISTFIIPVITVAIATIAKTLLISLVTFLFPNTNLYVTGLISYEFLFEFIENIILAPFIFKFLSIFDNSLLISTTKDKVDNV